MKNKRYLICLLVLFIAAFNLLQTRADAATFTVTKTADTNDGSCDAADCSLREAIVAANTNADTDTVSLPAGTYTLSIPGKVEEAAATGDLDITKDLTITGDGAATTIIDGNAIDRVFDIKLSARAVLNGVTIKNGNPGANSGGGIHTGGSATLTMNNCIISGNKTSADGGGIYNEGPLIITNSIIDLNSSSARGGGIKNDDTVTLTNVTISNNSSTSAGGGVDTGADLVFTNVTINGNSARLEGGGINLNGGTGATLTNVTITGNTSKGSGGGIFLSNGFTADLLNVTITNNTADSDGDNVAEEGGGIFIASGGILNIKNTIIANNTDNSTGAGAIIYPDCSNAGTFNSQGHNLIGNNTGCPFTSQTGDNVGTSASPINANLASLGNNGGGIQTILLLAGSPAIDAGDNTGCPATDERGFARPADGNGDGIAVCDIGAVELVCGNGIFEGSEACDDGNTDNNDACLNTCVSATCGDGAVQSAVEQCDNGANNSNTVADACRTNCTNPRCGDDVVDTGEGCDDGNATDGDGCSSACIAEATTAPTGAEDGGGGGCSLIRR